MTAADQSPPAFFSEPEHQPFRIGDGSTGILLLHGFVGTPAEVRPLAERLAAAGYATRGVLLPGFGHDIIRMGEVTRRDWLDAAGEAWAEVRATHDHAVLLGYSMGGAIATILAAGAPPDALVLLSPLSRLGGWQVQLLPLLKFIKPSIAPFADADFDDPAVRAQVRAMSPDADPDDPELRRFLREDVELPLTLLDEARRVGLAATRAADDLSAPTLVIQAAGDETVGPDHTRKLVREMSCEVTYVEVPGGHRFVRLEPGSYDYTPEILEFLASVLPAGARS